MLNTRALIKYSLQCLFSIVKTILWEWSTIATFDLTTLNVFIVACEDIVHVFPAYRNICSDMYASLSMHRLYRELHDYPSNSYLNGTSHAHSTVV